MSGLKHWPSFAKHVMLLTRLSNQCTSAPLFTARYQNCTYTFSSSSSSSSSTSSSSTLTFSSPSIPPDKFKNCIRNYRIDKDKPNTHIIITAEMEQAAKAFFKAETFAVVGASSDPSKFGHKIFNWYTTHSLPVIPINPSAPSITASSKSYDTLPNLSALPNPTTTSVSIITPPKVTVKVLEEAKKMGVKSVWLQPGTFDDAILDGAKKDFENAVGGDGWCVLVDGEKAGADAGLKL